MTSLIGWAIVELRTWQYSFNQVDSKERFFP